MEPAYLIIEDENSQFHLCPGVITKVGYEEGILCYEVWWMNYGAGLVVYVPCSATFEIVPQQDMEAGIKSGRFIDISSPQYFLKLAERMTKRIGDGEIKDKMLKEIERVKEELE